MSAVATSRPRGSGAASLARIVLYIVVGLGALLFMIPFFFAVSSSLKTAQEIRLFLPTLFPTEVQWANYPTLFEMANLPYGVWYRNRIIITGLSGSFAQTGTASTGVAVIPFLFIYFAGYDIAL